MDRHELVAKRRIHAREPPVHKEICVVFGNDLGEALGLVLADVRAIEPLELFDIENGRAHLHVIKRKSLHHLVDGKDLLVAVRPTEASEEIQQGFGQIAIRAVNVCGNSTVPLGELLFVRSEDHGQMGKLGYRIAEELIQVHLLGRVVDVVIATHDMGHARMHVIHHDRKVVGWRTVGTNEDEVIEVRILEFDRTTDHVLELNRAFERNGCANDIRSTGRAGLLARATAAIIHRLLACGLKLFAHFLDIGLGAPALVGMAPGNELFGASEVHIQPLALVNRLFVPVQSQPLHRSEDVVREASLRSLKIRVLDAEEELAPMLASVQPVKEGGTNASDMEKSSGRRSKPNPNGRLGWRVRCGWGHDRTTLARKAPNSLPI